MRWTWASTCSCCCRPRRSSRCWTTCTPRSGRHTAAGSSLPKARWTRKSSAARARASRSACQATCCSSARTCWPTAGLTPPPKTWQDVSDWSVKAQKPPKAYGMGLTLANNGDGNTQVIVVQSFGGAGRRRDRQEVHDQVGRHESLSAVDRRRVQEGPVPAGRHHLGRRGRQQLVPERAGHLHRQHRAASTSGPRTTTRT